MRLLPASMLAAALLAPHADAQLSMGVVQPADYMFASSRGRFESTVQSPASGAVAAISRIMLPTAAWACKNPRYLFTTVLGIQASTNPEQGIGNTRAIDAMLDEYPTGTTKAITIAAQATLTQSDLTILISDPVAWTIPANEADHHVILQEHVATGADMPGGYWTDAANGEGVETAATPAALTTYLTNTTGIAGQSAGAADGPLGMICQGWDGSPVVYMAGDSIGFGLDDNEGGDQRGNFDFVVRGLDDNLSSSRMVVVDYAVSSQSQAATSEGSTAAQHYAARIALLHAIQALNPSGDCPYSSMLSEHGVNDAATSGLNTALPAFWSLLHNICSGKSVVQVTLGPYTTDSADLWSSVAGQTPIANWGTGQSVQTFNAALVAGSFACGTPFSGGCADNVIDDTPYIWNTGVFNFPSFTTTFASSASASATTISLTAAPPIGDCLVLGPGTANVEAAKSGTGFCVTAVSGSGPYTVTLQAKNALSHASGDAVADAYTFGPPHFNPAGHAFVAGAIIAAKNAGVFK